MKTNTKRAVSLLASLALTLSSFGQAEEKKKGWADKAGPDHLTPFNVIGTKADAQKLQGSGTVLDSTDLKPFFHTDINEILRQVPGVYIRPEEGYGFFPNISLRGTDPNRSQKVTILEDGIPSSPSPFSDPSAYYSPTAGRMAGFEILKGSSQLKYGPNTTGGVINYLSTPIPNERKSHLRASYGSHNEIISHAYSGGKTDLGGGKFGYLVELFDHRSDGWKYADMETLLGQRNKEMPISKTDIMVKFSYEMDEDDYFEFKAGRTFMDADVSYQGTSLDDFNANPYRLYGATAWDNMDSHQYRYYVRHIKELSDSANLTTTVFHNEFNRDWYKLNKSSSAGRMAIFEGNADGNWTTKHNNRNYKVTGIQTNLDYQWENHSFDLGFRYTKDDYTQNPYTVDMYDLNSTANTIAYSVDSSDTDGTDPYYHSKAVEIYLTDTIDLGALSITPGVRYTDVEYTYETNPVRSVDDVLFGIGAGYEVSETFSLFGGVHQGHALPGAKGGSGHTTKGFRKIEESLSFEIGARGTTGQFGYEIAFFNTKFKDMIAGESLAAAQTETANVGDASINGLEVLVATDLGSADTFGIPVSISATFTNSEFDKVDTAGAGTGMFAGAAVGNEFAWIPDTQINARAGLEFDKTSTYLNYHWQDDVWTSAANTSKLEGYGVLDWSGFYNVSEGVTLFAKVTNLLDKEYAHSTLPAGYRPGAPRIASVGFEFDF
jgi:Fe(3+) dicitrate transport protein